MKINKRTVWQMTDDGMHIVEQDSHEYDGPVAQCFGGRSSTASTTTTDVDTTNIGLEDIDGLAIGAGGDVEFNQEVTDLGAVQGAFDFGESALDFGADVSRQAGETALEAVEISRQAVATVATGGQSDIAGINQRTILIIAAAAAAIFIIPQVIRRT